MTEPTDKHGDVSAVGRLSRRLTLPTPRTLMCLSLALLLFCVTVAIGEMADSATTSTVRVFGVTLTAWSADRLAYVPMFGSILLLMDVIVRSVCRKDRELGTATMFAMGIIMTLIAALFTFVAAVSNSRAELDAVGDVLSLLGCLFLVLALVIMWRFRCWLRSRKVRGEHAE